MAKNSPYKKNETQKDAWDVEVFDVKHILAQAKEVKGGMRFELAEHISLVVFDNEDADDTAILNVYGVSIYANIREYTKGNDTSYFLSLPSYKKKDGTYFEQVRNYSKNLNAIIKEVLNEYYN